MNQISDVILEVPFPAARCTPGSEAKKHGDACRKTWRGLNSFLEACAERFVYPDGCTQAQRQAIWDERAEKVDKLGREFVDALKVVHPTCTALYPHHAAKHAGDMFRLHGYWPGYGMDGIEAKHSVTKLLQRQVTNSKVYQRIYSIMSHYSLRDAAVENAKVCVAHC